MNSPQYVPEFEKLKFFGKEKAALVAGRSNLQLAHRIETYLRLPLTPTEIKNFKDGETYVQIQESVRGHDVYLIQPTAPPVNDSLMEMLIMIDALKRASAESINVVIPYFGYARQDRKANGREAITAKLVANLIETAGANRIISMDLHKDQIQGFFNIPVDHLYSEPVFHRYIQSLNLENLIIVSPDAGGVDRARKFAKHLDAPIAIIDKRRTAHNQAEVMNLVGDVKDRNVVIVDDMIDSGGTLIKATEALKSFGALSVRAVAAHPVFSDNAVKRIEESVLDEVIVSNTIALKQDSPKIRQLDVSGILGEAILRIHNELSVSEMFD